MLISELYKETKLKKNELAQPLSEDPLPLRKAKLTTEAATKKS